MRSWDDRIVSGDWGSDARGYLVNVLGGASSQSVIIMTGIDMVLSPFVDLNLPCHVERSCLSPSEVTLVLGLITLVSKPTLDVSSLLPLLDGDCQQQGDNNDEGSNDGEEERGQSNEEWNWQDAGESSEDTSGVINHFPYQTDDLTNILKIALERLNSQVSHRATSTSKPLVGSLPPRLKIGIEASLNGISLYISDDFPRSSPNPKSTTKQKKEDYSGNHSQSAEGITETDFCDSKFTRGDLNGPPRKQIIKPFSLHFITSLDLHPFLEDLRHPASNLNAYKREYYLSPTEETISTCYVSIETVAVNLSLLDMVRLLGTIETIQAVLPSSLTYRLLSGQTFTRANVGATRDTLITSEKTDNQPPTLSPLLLHSSSSPSTIFILKLNNAELCIVSEGNVSAPPILCLIAKRYYFVSESPSAAASAAIMPLPAHIDISGHASVAKRLDYRMVDKEKQSSHSIASSIETRVTFDDTKAVTHPAAASVTLFKIMCGNIYLTEGHRPLLYITGNKKISDALLTFMPHAAPNSRSGRDRRRLQADRTPFLAIRGHITNSMLTAAPYKLPSAAVSTADEVTPTVEDKEVCEKASLILYRSITLSTRLLCQKSPSADVATSSGKECGDGQKYGQDLMTGYVILDPSRVAVAIRNILRELLEGFG